MIPVRRPAALLFALVAALALAGCTGPDVVDPDGTATSTTSTTLSSTSSTSSSSTSSTPVTQPGVLTGPGVDGSQIILGTLIDSDADRGFLRGVQLWSTSVNDTGGICGRTVTLVGNGGPAAPADLVSAYRVLGLDVLGFVTLTDAANVGTELAGALTADQIPALTTEGTATDLGYGSPTVVAATADILAINALDQAVTADLVVAGDTIGVVTDGSPRSANALDGLRWYAQRAGLDLVVQTETGREPAVLRLAPVVFALGSPQLTASLVAELPAATRVITTTSGYDPQLLDPAAAGRVEIMLTTPAPGSDHPGAAAIDTALAAAGETAGGGTFAGYAAGATWGRLLTAACDTQNLTRAGVFAARDTVGPASAESLLGPSDPGLPATEQLPATRSSALAVADPSAPSGLAPLTGLIVAAGIDEYVGPVR